MENRKIVAFGLAVLSLGLITAGVYLADSRSGQGFLKAVPVEERPDITKGLSKEAGLYFQSLVKNEKALTPTLLVVHVPVEEAPEALKKLVNQPDQISPIKIGDVKSAFNVTDKDTTYLLTFEQFSATMTKTVNNEPQIDPLMLVKMKRLNSPKDLEAQTVDPQIASQCVKTLTEKAQKTTDAANFYLAKMEAMLPKTDINKNTPVLLIISNRSDLPMALNNGCNGGWM